MRGHDIQQAGMFSYLSPEERVSLLQWVGARLRMCKLFGNSMSTAISWIETLSHNNLGAVFSVLLDIKEQAEFDLGDIEIPLLPPHYRSDLLYPDGGIRNEEEEGNKRERALAFLEKHGLIKNLNFHPEMFVSETTVTLELVSSGLFDTNFTAVEAAIEGKPGTKSNKSSPTKGEFWPGIHSTITEIARPRFTAGHLADAVEASFKEINDRVKSSVKLRIGQENDGAPLMQQAFSLKTPIITLADMSSTSGRNEQLGYMEIFAGAMTGILNPKAHSNIVIDEKGATHLLYLTSLLMYKLGEAK
jgi:uncharacterized protein (TIGR02391 family)